MKIKCEYCGNYISDIDEKCSNCGAVNSKLKRVGNEVPTTIEELKKWYIEHNLPKEEVTRFFIGTNYEKPRAFGIYKDEKTNNFIVYKNKDDGTRAIRYEGKDENYAVNELYLKLKEEIQHQKSLNSINNKGNKVFEKNMHNRIYFILFMGFVMPMLFPAIIFSVLMLNDINSIIPIIICILSTVGIIIKLLLNFSHKLRGFSKNYTVQNMILLMFCFLFIILSIISLSNYGNGYYKVNGKEYYKYHSRWYIYENDNWRKSSRPSANNSINNYFEGNYYNSNSSYSNFKESDYYRSSSSGSSSYNSSWDSSSNWDSGSSWDSGSTNWSSDW